MAPHSPLGLVSVTWRKRYDWAMITLAKDTSISCSLVSVFAVGQHHRNHWVAAGGRPSPDESADCAGGRKRDLPDSVHTKGERLPLCLSSYVVGPEVIGETTE